MMLTATKKANSLGNRENVNVRDGNDITYAVDNLTNRYTSIAEANLTYNAAAVGCANFVFAHAAIYENRIVKITKAGQTKAEFAYDALGRRIEKKDLVDPNNTRRYYYNYNWQALCQYDGGGALKETFVYGNYIDEVLYKVPFFFYIHDHLFSPAALTHWSGSVLERYEYDAYGNPYILDTQYAPRAKSLYGNPYLFTGRSVDILDSGSLKIQYNRNRYYDYYTGRWLTHDPLGHIDGMNLYEYVLSNPILWTDSYGFRRKCDKCDPGDMKYDILDYIITPYHTNPWGKSAVKLGRAGTTGVTIGQVVLALYELIIHKKPSVMPTDVLNIFIVEEIFKELDKLDKELESTGVHGYLEIQLKECKKKCTFIWWCCRYDWAKYGKPDYYMCSAGSSYGLYEDTEHAMEYSEDCIDEFEEKWEEKSGKDFKIRNWGTGFIPIDKW